MKFCDILGAHTLRIEDGVSLPPLTVLVNGCRVVWDEARRGNLENSGLVC